MEFKIYRYVGIKHVSIEIVDGQISITSDRVIALVDVQKITPCRLPAPAPGNIDA